MTAPKLAAKPAGSAYANYAPLPGVPDEFVGADGQARGAWRQFFDLLEGDDSERSLAAAERHMRDIGVSYRVHGEARERPWPMSRLPLLIEESDWQAIVAGVTQRAAIMESLLADVYGPNRLVGDGVIPAAVVAGSQDFLRPLVGVNPPGGRWMHLYAADIGRGPDGRWWILGDRTQAPSGAGYALENRLVMARALPNAYRGLNVERVAPFFRALRSSLADAADRSQPRICLLTPGPYSETYFEQAYLARYLGFLLVEGDDLVVHNNLAHVRTIAGLKRADVIWRRVDSDFIDPLELNGESRLGVPGIISAMRHGHTVVSKAPGSGFVESRALMSFMPRIARHLLGEDLAMPNIATWWCGDRKARDEVLGDFGTMSISSAFSGTVPGFGTSQQILPAALSAQDQARLREAIEMRGLDYVGQEVVQLSTTPVSHGGEIVPRPFVLRVFAAATPDGWHVMPGAFCRISARPDARAISMGEGVQSADVWVLSSKPVGHETLLPATDDVPIRRILGNLPSRAADNLYWYGRYLERAEATIRVIRCLCVRSLEMDLSGDVTRTITKLGHQLVAWGAVDKENADADTLTIVRQALSDEDCYGSGLSGVRMAGYAASVIRERISLDASKLLRALDLQLSDVSNLMSVADVYEAADRALQTLSALAGLEQENMNRSAGWRFLDTGLRIERAINTCRLARYFAPEDATADDLDVMLDLIDSQITYRSRYLTGVALMPVRDMVLLDPYNPRSVGFQVQTLQQHLATLPSLRNDGIPEAPQQMIARLATEIATSEARELDATIILALEQKISNFAQAVANRYFSPPSRNDGGTCCERPCVIYRIRHLTAYSYDTPVASATLALRVTPRDGAAQRTIANNLEVSPKPASVVFERDFYGNVVNVVTIDESHTELAINATAEVEVSHRPPLSGPGTDWERVADAALHDHDLSPQAPAHFMFASPRIQLSADVTRYAAESFRPGRGIIEAARDLMTRIKREFVYQPESTEIWTPLSQAFAARRGVCQDFAHIMIAGLRGLGVPAAYVSGYPRTAPLPGKERLEGADATHAWVSVWCGTDEGWLGFDPTNAIDTGNDHIALAIGRDFSDVSPVYGVFVGSGANELRVEVDVIPLPRERAA